MRCVDRPGDREYFAPLIERIAGGDERPAAQRRLDDEDAARQSTDQTIATREVPWKRRASEREFRKKAAALGELFAKGAVARGINAFRARAEDRNARARARKPSAVGG